MKIGLHRKLIYLATAVVAGTSLTAATKRMELDGRLDALLDADPKKFDSSAKLAQWLNQNPWQNWNNWLNN